MVYICYLTVAVFHQENLKTGRIRTDAFIKQEYLHGYVTIFSSKEIGLYFALRIFQYAEVMQVTREEFDMFRNDL